MAGHQCVRGVLAVAGVAEEHQLLSGDESGRGYGPALRVRDKGVAERALRAYAGRQEGGAEGVS